MVELTEEEKSNGWTAKKLESYLEERERAQMGVISFHPEYRTKPRPKWANNLYNPRKWR